MKTCLLILSLLFLVGCQSSTPTGNTWQEVDRLEQKAATADATPTKSSAPAGDWLDVQHVPARSSDVDIPLNDIKEKPLLPPWLEVSVGVAFAWRIHD